MKSPAEIQVALRRQWENPTYRETRLLGGSEVWPVVSHIGRLTQQMILKDIVGVKRQLHAWRQVKTGEVVWKKVRYRLTTESTDIPCSWILHNSTDWIEAINDLTVRDEFRMMSAFIEQSDPIFHSVLIRKRSLWQNKPIREVVEASRAAVLLGPKFAEGRPLRTLAPKGMDTKFFERNAQLLTKLLDVRFDEEVSRIGLENFLDAFREDDHWLLVVDLDGSLLPFKKSRVRSSELRTVSLPGDRLIIVENETSQHQLPQVSGTIAVLGAGFDLSWTEGNWLASKEVAYWGDIDTWGLHFLAKARRSLPHLAALLMTSKIYDQFPDATVNEPVVASSELPCGLTLSEQELYQRLFQESRGRLEQEFLPKELTQETIVKWASQSLRKNL